MFSRAGRGARMARRVPDGPLRRYLEAVPPAPTTPLSELSLLAVDMEATGLDPARDRVLSVGLVPVDGETIRLGGARSTLVRPDDGVGEAGDGVGQSAVFHGLTDDAVATGVPVSEAVDMVLGALVGRVLLAHFARIEVGFLQAVCERLQGVRPPITVVDTLELQYRLVAGSTAGFGAEPTAGELRLWAARERYGLPVYRAHDPLVDALACAELYLAQTRELGAHGGLRLKDVSG